MAIYKENIVDIDLEKGQIHRAFLNHSIGMYDQKADRFGIRVFRDGEPVDLTGVSVQGVFKPPQGSPIAITGSTYTSVSGNIAEVILPQACYNYEGTFTLAIKLVDSTNSVTGTMRIVDGMVDNTHASGTVAPTGAVPTYQEVLAVYDELLQDVTDYESVVANQDAKIDDLKSAFNSVTEQTCNLYVPENVLGMYITASPTKIKDDPTSRMVYIPCKKSTTYTIFKTAGKRFKVGYIEAEIADSVTAYGVEVNNTGSRLVVTTGANALYLVAYVWGAADTLSKETILSSIMIFEGEIAADYLSEYVPPISATGTMDFMGYGWIAAGTDLDTIVGPVKNGYYLMAYADEFTHDPIGKNTRRILKVFSSGGRDTSRYAIQSIEDANTGVEFIRYNANNTWSDWIKITDGRNAFMRQSALTTSVNFNDVKSLGIYYAPYSTGRTNAPVNSACMLIVYQDVYGDTTSGIVQILVSWKFSEIYTRHLDGGTWSAWKKTSNDDEMFMRRGTLSSSDNLDSITTHGQYYMPYSSMPSNSPTTSASILLVYQDIYGDTTSGVIQKVMSWKYDEEWKRSLNGGSWTEWKKESVSYTVCDLENKYLENIRFPLNDSVSVDPYTSEQKVVTLLHFSDLHSDAKSYNSLMNWANNRKSYYDDILCTGDIVNWYREDEQGTGNYLDFWKAQDGNDKILITIGNHDAKDEQYSSHDGWIRKTVAHSRELYMYGISGWGVTSPENTTWWYKDYSNSDVRLIGLDTTIEWNTTDDESQLAWFQNVLADAKTNGKSVIVAHHYIPASPVLVNSDFTADNRESIQEPAYFRMNSTYHEAVESFISNSGKFVCWLVGHTHADYVVYNSNYPNQMFFCVTSLWNDLRTSDQARTEGTPSEVAANLIGFDTQRKLIKISRIGAMSNYNLRPREMMVYNYETKTIVRQSSGMAT